MTGAVTVAAVFMMGLYWVFYGPILFDEFTIYKFAFRVVTACAAGWLIYASGRSNYAYAFVLVLYCLIAPNAYYATQPLLVSMLIDLAMAVVFATGAKVWHTGASACFVAAVAVSILTYIGVVPMWHRWDIFVDFSQQDLNAILGYMALIICGMGAGDSGIRVMDKLARPSVVAGAIHRFSARAVAMAKMEAR